MQMRLKSSSSGFGRAAAGLVVLAALLSPAAAHAMVSLPADFTEVVTGSALIVHGRVTGVRAQATEGRRSIETIVTLSVTEPLKGRPGATVVFRLPGGQLGRYRRVVVGAPQLAQGDEVVVFLNGRLPALPVPFGLGQGVYRVVTAVDGRAVVTTPVVQAGAGVERVVRGDPARRPVTMDAFVREVRAVLQGAR